MCARRRLLTAVAQYYELIEQNWAGVGAVEFVTKMYAQEAATRGYWHASSLAEGDGWINCFSTDATNNTANYGSTTYHYLWTHIPEIPYVLASRSGQQ